MKRINCKQLQSYGISRYHVAEITKNLSSTIKHKQIYLYELKEVITEIRNYIQKPRIHKSSREKLEMVLDILLELLGNVIEVPFLPGIDPELRTLVNQLAEAMSKTNVSLAELKADRAEIRYKYGILT
jgi:hypothetical protein